MREIRFKFKLARKRGERGASVCLVVKQWKKFKDYPFYWLITLPYGGYACPIDDTGYIKCINHEVMHCILDEIDGVDAMHGWDNIVKIRDGEYCGNPYGWKNIMGKHLPDVYCEKE